jgi:hypothetical protein
MYYAVTGKVPFPGGTTRDKARKHCDETPWHPRRFAPELSEEFVELIADMMEKEPDDRISSAGDVVTRLEPWSREAVPMQLLQSRSFWMPPPPPAASPEDDLQATVEGAYVGPEHESSSPSGWALQSTDRISAAGQDTVGEPRQPPIPSLSNGIESLPRLYSPRVVALLAVVIPLAMLAGAGITLLALALR